MRSIQVFAVVVFVLSSGPQALGQCEPVTASKLGGFVNDVELVGDIAYLAASGGGLHVVDVSDPADPVLVANLWQLDQVSSLQAQGDVLYLAAGNGGLITLDISEPSSPMVIGLLDVPGYVSGIAVEGSRVYLGASEAMYIVDVTDASEPVLLGVYDAPGFARTPVADGLVVYLPINDQGLHIVNAADPANPVLIATIDSVATPRRMRIVEDTLYVTGDGVQIFDISDPSSPIAIAMLETSMSTSDIEIVGDLGYLAVNNGSVRGRLWVIDLTSLDKLRIIGSRLFDEGGANRVLVRGDRAYVGGFRGGLHIVDVADPTDPVEIGTLKAPYFIDDLQIQDGVAFLAEGSSNDARVMTVDISDPTFPVVLGWLTYDGNARAIDVDTAAGIAYVADSNAGVHIIDISDLEAPILVDTVRLQRGADEIHLAGDRLFVDDHYDLRIYDVSDRRAPLLIGELNTARGLDVNGNLLFLATVHDGLQILNISDPSEPLFIGEYPIAAEPVDVVVVDRIAYLAVESRLRQRGRDPAGLYIFDVANPSNPTLVSFIGKPNLNGTRQSLNRVRHVEVHNQVAYLGDLDRGVFLYDVSDPAYPRPMSTIQTFSYGAFRVDGDSVFLTAASGGLVIKDISSCRGCRADIDGDGDIDAEDFFAYLDLFAAGDARADIDGDADIDAEDFFGYLDLFVAGC